MNTRLIYFFISVLLLSALSVVAASFAPRVTTTTASTVQVVASFYPLAEFAAQIGKDKITVTNLTPPGAEPHDFEPTPQDSIQLQQSDLFIYNNAGLEPWVERVVPEVQEAGVHIVKASQEIQLLLGDEREEGEAERGDSGQFDPHFWLDPVLASKVVDNIMQGLVAVDSTNRIFYEANAAAYKQKLNQLDQEFRATLNHCERRDIVTSHNAFSYLAKRYTLRVESLTGISPDEEPSPQRLAQIAEFARRNQVEYIFFETLLSPRLANTIAREVAATTLVFNPLEGLSAEEIKEGKNYISVQQENLRNLSIALGCQQPNQL